MSSAVVQLSDIVTQGKPSHAYLMVSSSGDMPKLLRDCAKILMCGVGEFHSAHSAKIDAKVHSDCMALPRKGNTLLVDDITYLIEESYKRPVDDSPCRIFMLDATKSIGGSTSAIWQNKLLKTLEEPIGNTHILIGVRSKEGVLPTILSRCQILVHGGEGYSTILRELLSNGYKEEPSRLATALSQNVESASLILADTTYYAVYQLVLDMLTNMKSTADSLLYAHRLLAQSSYADKILPVLNIVMREALVCRVDGSLCRLGISQDVLTAICHMYSVTACRMIIEVINSANVHLAKGGNIALVVDRLLVKMLEERYKCKI